MLFISQQNKGEKILWRCAVRKGFLTILLSFMLLFTMSDTGYCNTGASITVKATIQQETGRVTIEGVHSMGEGQEITVMVTNPKGSLDYVNQTTSQAEGIYTFSYVLPKKTEGTYGVRVGGKDVLDPVETTLTYKISTEPEEPSSPSEPEEASSPSTTTKEKIQLDQGVATTQIKASKQSNSLAEAKISADIIHEMFRQTKEEQEGTKRIVLEIPEIKEAKGYVLTFRKESLNQEPQNHQMEIKTALGNLQLPLHLFHGVEGIHAEEIQIQIQALALETFPPTIREAIGNRPAIELSLLAEGQKFTWKNSKAPIKVQLSYKPSEAEQKKQEHLVIWSLDPTGKSSSLPNGRYNPTTGSMTFTTTGLGSYGVAYVEKTFADLSDHEWARKAIEVMASKGIIQGTSATTYDPAAPITRGDFLTLLVRVLELEAEASSNFTDVPQEAHYYEALGIAKELGIVQGVGNHQFYPEKTITREDLMVMVDRALAVAGQAKEKGTLEEVRGYQDVQEVSSYAIDSVARLIKMGLIQGYDGKINPKGQATRAETAVMIERLYYR